MAIRCRTVPPLRVALPRGTILRKIRAKVLLGVAPLLLVFTPVSGAGYTWPVIKVIDGDTVKFRVTFLPKELPQHISVRILNIDTPEKAPRAKCPAEAALALKATEFTKQAVAAAKKVEVTVVDWDKFGGRVLGHIVLDGKDLATQLVAANLAREYHGAKKSDWCK